jgi:hypothetical protein
VIVPHDAVSLPDGTAVTITVEAKLQGSSDAMSEEAQRRYLAALARIDAVANENPGDDFSGADHDRELYGNGS